MHGSLKRTAKDTSRYLAIGERRAGANRWREEERGTEIFIWRGVG